MDLWQLHVAVSVAAEPVAEPWRKYLVVEPGAVVCALWHVLACLENA